MQGIERGYLNASIRAVLSANANLLEASVEEALSHAQLYGKPDTLGLDAWPEITIMDSLALFDANAIVITEERSAAIPKYSNGTDPRNVRTFFISDPTDRSLQFSKFLETAPDKKITVGKMVHSPEAYQAWEASFGAPVTVTGAFSAITCVRGAVPICSVKVNYITQTLFVACSAGIFEFALPSHTEASYGRLKIEDVRDGGKKVLFVKHRDTGGEGSKRFVTFLGKSGYAENFRSSRLVRDEDRERLLAYGNPGGPSRVLYLTDLLPQNEPIGFILANGEKVGEWVHWIPYVTHAKVPGDDSEPALLMFEIHQDCPQTKDGVLMATPPSYSVFREMPDGKMVLDVAHFAKFENPSRLRSTLLVCPSSNRSMTPIMRQYGYRQIVF